MLDERFELADEGVPPNGAGPGPSGASNAALRNGAPGTLTFPGSARGGRLPGGLPLGRGRLPGVTADPMRELGETVGSPVAFLLRRSGNSPRPLPGRSILEPFNGSGARSRRSGPVRTREKRAHPGNTFLKGPVGWLGKGRKRAQGPSPIPERKVLRNSATLWKVAARSEAFE